MCLQSLKKTVPMRLRRDHDNRVTSLESGFYKISKANYKSFIIGIEFNLVAASGLRLSRYARRESLLATEAVEGLCVRSVGEIMTRQSAADKLPALTHRFHSS